MRVHLGWCYGALKLMELMKEIFESNEAIQSLINGFCSTDSYKEAMKARKSNRVCGTLTKRHPEGYYVPVKIKCYRDDNTKVIPTDISEEGVWGGLMITPNKIQVVTGEDYKEIPNDGIEIRITYYGQDLTAIAKKAANQYVREHGLDIEIY